MRHKKLLVMLVSLLLMGFISVLLINAFANPIIEQEDTVNINSFSDAIYASNRYTRADATTASVDNSIVTLDGFEYVCSDGDLDLYVNKTTYGIRIKNNATGYVWGSSFTTADQRLNSTWKARVESALWISYYHKTSVRDELKEEVITASAANKFEKLTNGFKVHVKFNESKIELDMIVTLVNGIIDVQIPYESIVENEKDVLAVIKVFPFYGAMLSREDGPLVEGYTLIPDGSGALIRYKSLNESLKSFYTKTIYGKDYGLNYSSESETIYNDTTISIPLIGFVHGINRNASFVEAVQGDEYARIISYEVGKTTEFYWTTFEFVYRNQYQTKISRTSSILTTQSEKNQFNIDLNIGVLANNDANYLGIANSYHDKLVNDQKLKDNNLDNVPLHISFLASEIEKTTFSNRSIPLTKTTDMIEILGDIKAYANNISTSIQGWSGLGYTGVAPYYNSFNKVSGGTKGYKELINYANSNNINLFFEADYQKGYERSKGYSKMRDLAQMANSNNIMGNTYEYSYYYLNPAKTYDLLKDDLKFYSKHNINSLCLLGLGDMCYSNWDKDQHTALIDSIRTYQNTLSLCDTASTYGTFAYVYPYVTELYKAPMYSSQINLFTDTVPFVSYVLKDSITLYGEYLNSITDLDDEVLRMIDFNIFPSIRLTKESAVNLLDTPSRDLVSSKYSSWKQILNEKYQMFNMCLANTLGEKLVSRQILMDGVVKNTYENGVTIYINYLNKDVTIDGVTLLQNNIKVGGMDE